jgi:hypothetical protein
MTKAAAIKAEIDRSLAAVEEATETLHIADHKIIITRSISRCNH